MSKKIIFQKFNFNAIYFLFMQLHVLLKILLNIIIIHYFGPNLKNIHLEQHIFYLIKY